MTAEGVDAPSAMLTGSPQGLLPALLEGGLRRGSTVVLARGEGSGVVSLVMALLAGTTNQGWWAAVVGIPGLGLAAAAEIGVDLSRLALVPEPGGQWAEVTAALLDGLDVVVVRLSTRVGMDRARRLSARARQRRAVLVLVEAMPFRWPEPDLRIVLETSRWLGLETGHGHLRSRQAEVAVGGRRSASRVTRSSMWLPDVSGTVGPIRAAPDVAGLSSERMG